MLLFVALLGFGLPAFWLARHGMSRRQYARRQKKKKKVEPRLAKNGQLIVFTVGRRVDEMTEMRFVMSLHFGARCLFACLFGLVARSSIAGLGKALRIYNL